MIEREVSRPRLHSVEAPYAACSVHACDLDDEIEKYGIHIGSRSCQVLETDVDLRPFNPKKERMNERRILK